MELWLKIIYMHEFISLSMNEDHINFYNGSDFICNEKKGTKQSHAQC